LHNTKGNLVALLQDYLLCHRASLVDCSCNKKGENVRAQTYIRSAFVILGITGLFIAACSTFAPIMQPTATATTMPPAWFGIKMTDVRTGQTFSISDFAGKVVLIETIAWSCYTCQEQQDQVKEMRRLLGNPKDLISVSLDVASNENEAELKDYAAKLGYDWYFAVAPLEVVRALGNLYSAEYLNYPLSPMLIIDRQGSVYGLPYGFKPAVAMKNTLEQYLTP
jgi:hypothetical protein